MGEPFLHFDKFDDFNSKKLSANEENTKYTIGVDGAVTSGSPDIPWDKICWVKDEQKIWTHGKLYDCSPFVNSIEGKINLSSITEIKAAQNKLTQTNEVAYYLITDRSGRLPSTEACYDIPSDCVKQLSMRSPDTLSNSALTLATSVKDVSPIGVNVGDLIAITRAKVGVSDLANALGITLNLGSEVEIYQYKVLSTNDVKAPDTRGTEVGVMGLASPWDKQQINKIPTIESNLSTTASELNRGNKKQVFDADNYNIDRCLNAGIYKYGRTGRSMPDNHSDEYYIVDADTRYNRSDSLYYVTQKVYSVNYPNRAFERLITTTSIDNYNGTYSDWVQIGKDSYTRNEIETNYATKTYVGEQISGLVGTAPDTLDTIYELSAALKDNKDIVDVLEESIANKADKSSIPTKVSQLTNDSGYITSVAKGTATTQATAQTLMCDVNINGKTVTPVKFNGTVGGYGTPIFINAGKPTPINSFPEAYLSFGGQNITNGYGPIDASLVNVLGANRFDGLPAGCITVEYSRDGGATWLDYGATDKQKVDMVSQTADNAILYIGKNDTDNPVNANHKLRVIINTFTQDGANRLYSELRKFIIYVTNASNYQTTCTIKKRAQSDYAAGNNVWTVVSENIPITGWSNYNVINTAGITTYGNQDNQSREIMFEFSIGNPPTSGRGFSILKIFAYGGVGWVTPSNMAARGHLYSYDYQQNAKFPAKVDAVGGLQENGTNLSSKYLGINAAAKSISDGTTTITPSAIKTMAANLENVISDVVSIDTSLFPTSTDEVIGFRQTNGGDGVGYSEAWLDRLKGNTVVWNQLSDTSMLNAYSVAANNITVVNDGKKVTVTNTAYAGAGGDEIAVRATSKKTAIGHKILVSLNATFSNSSHYVLIEYGANSIEIRDGNNDGIYEAIYTATKEKTVMLFKAAGQKTIGDTWTFSNIKVVDLTQMFGAGNEPTTIEEFNARKPLGVTDDYNEGELISTTADELKSVGFNLLNIDRKERPYDKNYAPTDERVFSEDEFWNGAAYNGYYRQTNLYENIVITDSGISATQKNTNNIGNSGYGIGFPLKVLPNTKYNISFTTSNTLLRIGFHDKNGVNITFNSSVTQGGSFTTPDKTRWAVLCFTASTDTYRIDISNICIHLVHTGTRNGQYEPYKEYRLPLPIKDIKDKDGNQLFPNGLLSAGTAYDEITATKAIKRIGVVDMGSLEWTYRTGDVDFLSGVLNTHPKFIGESMCALYGNSKATSSSYQEDKTLRFTQTLKCIVKDTSYTNAATFKAAMSGVMLYYELAEPIEVDIEEWDRSYEVSDFGTEEVISDTPTTPLKADIIYEYNAKGRIEANERGIEELNDKIVEMNEYSITSDKVWSEDTPVDCTIGEVDNDSFLPDGVASVGGKSRISRMYVKFSTTDNSYSGEMVSEYSDNCLIIGVKGYYELTAPNGTMLKRGYLGDSNVKVEQTSNIGYSFNFTALDMEEGMNVRVGAILEYIDID